MCNIYIITYQIYVHTLTHTYMQYIHINTCTYNATNIHAYTHTKLHGYSIDTAKSRDCGVV